MNFSLRVNFAKKNNFGKNVGSVGNLANEKGKAFDDSNQYSRPIPTRYTSFLFQDTPEFSPQPFQFQKPPMFAESKPYQQRCTTSTTSTNSTASNTTNKKIAPEDIGVEGMQYTEKDSSDIVAEIGHANTEALRIKYGYLKSQYKKHAQDVYEASKEIRKIVKTGHVFGYDPESEQLLQLSKDLVKAQKYLLSIMSEYSKGAFGDSVKTVKEFLEMCKHPVETLKAIGFSTILASALVFNDGSLSFEDAQRKEDLIRHYTEGINKEIINFFTNTSDQEKARKVGQVCGRIVTGFLLAKGIKVVKNKVISSASKVVKNITNIIKGEEAFVDKLKKLDPKIKKVLTPVTTGIEEASNIIEKSKFKPKNVGKVTGSVKDNVNVVGNEINKRGKVFEDFEKLSRSVGKKVKVSTELVNEIQKWPKLSLDKLKTIGIKSLQKDIRAIWGSAEDAWNFFNAQVISLKEVKKGVFVGKDTDGIIFTYRAASKSGPPTIDVNGVLGLRKIKFINKDL
ncbi:hypothetical protein ACFLYH_03495 [Candidatus Dependentiae bacterium]